ncbi:MAG: FAD-binding protein [Wenzhouxiangellaceae bacterium]|nr:MAG: FAD-binding protein [Wenzhouxiangellaceae bacterium]
MKAFDVIVNGGGLAGATLAVALARTGRRVAVIEATGRIASSQPSYDDRTLVINAASLNILCALELLPDTLTRMPVARIEVSRAGGFGHLVLEAKQFGRERFGAVIIARELGQVLLQALASTPGIASFCPDRLVSFKTDQSSVSVELASGTVLNAALLVGADGNHSAVRQLAGLPCQRHDYGESAMIFNIQARLAPTATAWERFTPQGPLALLPQSGGRLGVVWIDRSEAIAETLNWPDQHLLDKLVERLGQDFGGLSRPGKRACYPLVRQRTPWPVSQRVVVVGNAANAVHPVSAQGFNLGLRDVGGLVDVLNNQDDPGNEAALLRYARVRQDDQDSTVRYTDTLARAFTNPSRLARLMSGIGLAAHAAWPTLGARLAQAAMGFREPVCSLARESTSAAREQAA